MTKQELYELTTKLYECSITMKEINMDCSDILLQMASSTLDLLEKKNIPDDIKIEIENIKLDILND